MPVWCTSGSITGQIAPSSDTVWEEGRALRTLIGWPILNAYDVDTEFSSTVLLEKFPVESPRKKCVPPSSLYASRALRNQGSYSSLMGKEVVFKVVSSPSL